MKSATATLSSSTVLATPVRAVSDSSRAERTPDVSPAGAFARGMKALLGACGLALLLPVLIVLLPLTLLYRLVLDAAGWPPWLPRLGGDGTDGQQF